MKARNPASILTPILIRIPLSTCNAAAPAVPVYPLVIILTIIEKKGDAYTENTG